jgi:hypothetical protein
MGDTQRGCIATYPAADQRQSIEHELIATVVAVLKRWGVTARSCCCERRWRSLPETPISVPAIPTSPPAQAVTPKPRLHNVTGGAPRPLRALSSIFSQFFRTKMLKKRSLIYYLHIDYDNEHVGS